MIGGDRALLLRELMDELRAPGAKVSKGTQL